MANKKEALQYYQEVATSEQAWLNEHAERLATQLEPSYLRDTLLAANFSTSLASRSKPRLSLRLLGYAFDELYNLYDIKNPEPHAIDGTSEVLAGILEEYMLPLSGIPVGGAEVKAAIGGNRRKGGLCRLGEPYFYKALQQTVHPAPSQQKNVMVYHTAEGKPVALQKYHDAKTALTLEGMSLVGRPIIPPGTIIEPMGELVAGQTGEFITPHCTFTTHVVKEPLPLIIGRMSAWAYPKVLDRCLFAVINEGRPLDYDVERAAMLTGTTLDDFRQAAYRVMDMCEVRVRTVTLAGSATAGSRD